MLLFKPEHVEPILRGVKIETRRIWKRCRVRVDALHLGYVRPPFCNPPGEPFARLRIMDAWEEKLGDITDLGVFCEGYNDRESYLKAFFRINQIKGPYDVSVALGTFVHVVRFRCEEDLRGAA
jgi:hypothetical protein